MLKKLFIRLVATKSGLLIVLLLVGATLFYLGTWWGRQAPANLPGRKPPVSAEEQAWQEAGLSFGDGLYFVGTEIEPGIYRTKGTDTSLFGCSWQRLSGFSAESDNLIVNYYDDHGMPTIVEIAKTDKGFQTKGCGQWYAASVPITDDADSFSDGAFIVGTDIQPGTYRSSASWGCYWERLSGFTRNFHHGRLFDLDKELIANSRNTVATIKPTDKGFVSFQCLKWTKQDTPASSPVTESGNQPHSH